MSHRILIGFTLLLLICAAVGLLGLRHWRRLRNRPFTLTGSTLTDFASLEPIDVHVHVFQSSPQLVELLQRLHMHAMDILYVDDTNKYLKDLDSERAEATSFIDSTSGLATLCTTFDPFRFRDREFSHTAVEGLNRDFAKGAVAAKIWKNVGMEIVDSSGKYLLADDPRFEPIYKDIADQHKTLVAHVGDPDTAWGEQESTGFHSNYYATHPEWDMSKKNGTPSKKTLLEAEDHVLAGNPALRVVGAHLGSDETHLDQLASRLERYPNFAVDTAARVRQLMSQPSEQVRAFILKYQDRILYGTDLSVYKDANVEVAALSWEREYALDWRYFATDDVFEYQGRRIHGLGLPREVLRKLYHDNAVKWIPGIVPGPPQ